MVTAEDFQKFLIEARPRARLRVSEGLYVRRSTNGPGGGSFTFKFTWRDGIPREIGLGAVENMSLEVAKAIASRCALQVRHGHWPGLEPERPPRPTRVVREVPQCATAPP